MVIGCPARMVKLLHMEGVCVKMTSFDKPLIPTPTVTQPVFNPVHAILVNIAVPVVAGFQLDRISTLFVPPVNN